MIAGLFGSPPPPPPPPPPLEQLLATLQDDPKVLALTLAVALALAAFIRWFMRFVFPREDDLDVKLRRAESRQLPPLGR